MKAFPIFILALIGFTGPVSAGTWTKRNVSVPRPTSMPPSHQWFPYDLTLVYDFWRRVTVALGGHADPQLYYLAVNEYDGVQWRSRYDGSAADTPTHRRVGGAAFDSRRGVTVIFGGWTGSSENSNDELWEYDGTRWTRRTWTGPGPRESSSAHLCFDSVRGRTICLTSNPAPGVWETWEWTGTAWDRAPDLTGVNDTSVTKVVFDEGRNRAFVYTTAYLDDLERTWEFVPGATAPGGVWRHVPINGAPDLAPVGVALYYDPHRERILRHGGRAKNDIYSYRDSTSTWDPAAASWSITGVLPGQGRGGASICYDRHRAVAVLYGGLRVYVEDGTGRTTTYTDTWEFSNPPPGDVWVSFLHTGAETGTPHQPWNTMAEALPQAPFGSVIWIKGSTSATLDSAIYRSTPVTLRAWDGPTTIGQ